MTHINFQMLNILRSESSEINSAFTHAEQISKNRATLEKEIENMRQNLTDMKSLEVSAFHNAVEMVTT